jgi:hypothetical protein
MRQYLQALPLGAEFAIVILGGFGFFFLGAFVMVLTKTGAGDAGSTGVYTSGHLIQLIVYELPVGLALLGFLRLRGWSLERLGVRFSAGETLAGFGLAFVAELACYVPLIAVALAFPASVEAMSAAQATPGGFGLATVIVLCIVNPIFEETFVCGYVITVLKERADRGDDQRRHPPALPSLSGAARVLRHRPVRPRGGRVVRAERPAVAGHRRARHRRFHRAGRLRELMRAIIRARRRAGARGRGSHDAPPSGGGCRAAARRRAARAAA